MHEQSRYRVDGLLGRGGMGSVERAIDTVTGKSVALKRLITGDSEGERRKRAIALFEREYHVLAQLEHPGIVEVYEYGVDDIGPYYAMELLDGEDASANVPMPYQRACALMRDVASSLAIVHARGFVHRDVTPKNVRCTSDGRAKLIDFGAMCPMGVAKTVVGTPPFVPPEAVQQTALDGRTDLYALGASLYHLLTGRHAYPARTFAQLRDMWRSPIPTPSMMYPEIPVTLSRLVMELLSPAAAGRPSSAAHVYERLTGIGGLPRGEQVDVAKAYLSAPSLVGRGDTLSRCSARLIRAVGGHGSTVLLQGEAGVGRSRLLDAAALEAQLLGATVLRSDASDVLPGGIGVLERIASELLRARPEQRALADDPILARFLNDLERRGSARADDFDRAELLAAASAWLRKVSQRTLLVITVDDLHLLDEPSLAFVASLANVTITGARILLVATKERSTDTRSEAALALIRTAATAIDVEPLSQDALGEMLASMFGGVVNIGMLASVMFRGCGGNPGVAMAHARDLVDAGVVRYESGAWAIPVQSTDIERIVLRPDGVTDRLRELPEEARELAHALALDRDELVTLPDYVSILSHSDSGRVHSAVADLVRAHVLVPQGAGYAFARSNYRAEIVAAIDPDARKRLHTRLSALFEGQAGKAIAYVHHLTHAGELAAARQVVAKMHISPATMDHDMRSAHSTLALRELLLASTAAGAPRGQLTMLRAATLRLASMQGEWELVSEHADDQFADLVQDCGLSDYAQLEHLPADQRVWAALGAAQARYDARPEHERGFTVEQTLNHIGELVLGTSACAWSMFDQELMDRVPSLAPFTGLARGIALVERMRIAIHDMLDGMLVAAWDNFRTLFEEMRDDKSGLTPQLHAVLYIVVLGFLQGIEAAMAKPEVLERCGEVERVNKKLAESERLGYYLAIGDLKAVAATRKRMELLQVQSGQTRHDPTHWGAELANYWTVQDVVGMKRCVDEAAQMQHTRPGWAVRRKFAETMYKAICSTEDAAAEVEALVKTMPERHPDYPTLFATHMALLIEAGQYERVTVEARAYADRNPNGYAQSTLMQLALAQAHLGQREQSMQIAEGVIGDLTSRGVRGMFMGFAYESAARVALVCRDTATFERYAAQCAEELKIGRNPGLTSRYERLINAAHEQQMNIDAGLENAAQFTMRTVADEFMHKVNSQLVTMMEPSERRHNTLRMMLEGVNADGGFLYLASDDGPELVATNGNLQTSDTLDGAVRRFWHTHVTSNEMDDMATTMSDAEDATAIETAADAMPTLSFEANDQMLRPYLLQGKDGRPIGILLIAPGKAGAVAPRSMLDALAKLLATGSAA